MSSRYGVFCVLLLLILAVLGYQAYNIWSSPVELGQREGGKKEARPLPAPPLVSPKQPAPREAFNVIAEKNPFNPERKEFPVAAEGGAPGMMAKPIARPIITLYGVALGDHHETASIINPGRPLHKGERETKTIKVGDMVGEYKVTKILQDRIVMEAGEDSFEVLLYDPRAPKKRMDTKTPVQPAAVTSTASGPVAPGGTPAPPAPAAAPPASVPPPGVAVSSPVPRPAPAAARPPGALPEGTYQPAPSTSTPAPPQNLPDPGVWRGRRPGVPGAALPQNR